MDRSILPKREPRPLLRPRGWKARSGTRDESGLALIATLFVLMIVAVIIAGTFHASLSDLRTMTADHGSTRAFYAAEAGAEAALSQVEAALLDGVLDESELAGMTPPTLSGFEYTEFEVVEVGEIEKEIITDGPYAGMYSLTQNLEIKSKVTDPMGTHAAVVLGAKAQAIPIFQFATFFQGGFVDCAGSRKDMLGRVHSNTGLFLCGSDLHFHSTLTTPGGVWRDSYTDHEDKSGIHAYIKDASSTENELTFDSEDTPDPEQFKSKSDDDFDGRLKSGAFGVDSLNLPLPEGMDPRELIRPKEDDDTDMEKRVKFAWKADMYVTVDLGDNRDADSECDNNPPSGAPSYLPRITIERPFGGSTPDDETKCGIFRFRWESFYDNAEEAWTDVLDVHMDELRSWVNSTSSNVEIVYIEFKNVDSSPSPGSTDSHNDGDYCDDEYCPVLKIVNGSQLHGPVTIGSEYPLYAQGDYNTVSWKPSALFGDRLAALSNDWAANESDVGDYNNPSTECRHTGDDCPEASHTTQYFAVVTGTGEGNIGCFHEDPSCTTTPPYGGSGWVKMLEDWKGGSGQCPSSPESGRCVHTMIGSYISLWAPAIASPYGGYPGSKYYRRPVRDWSFDTRFENPDSLPPGTPVVGQVFRAAFREAY